jgi:hypothetical protein
LLILVFLIIFLLFLPSCSPLFTFLPLPPFFLSFLRYLFLVLYLYFWRISMLLLRLQATDLRKLRALAWESKSADRMPWLWVITEQLPCFVISQTPEHT